MINRLRVKISKLRYEGNITNEEYKILTKLVKDNSEAITDTIRVFEAGLYHFGQYDPFAQRLSIYCDDLEKLIEQLKEQQK